MITAGLDCKTRASPWAEEGNDGLLSRTDRGVDEAGMRREQEERHRERTRRGRRPHRSYAFIDVDHSSSDDDGESPHHAWPPVGAVSPSQTLLI